MSVASHHDDSKIMESQGFDPAAITFLRLVGTLPLQFRNSMSPMLTLNLLTTEPTLDPKESRQAQMDLEGDTGWRGMSLRSADPIKATENVPW
jgi:hypothetical protein